MSMAEPNPPPAATADPLAPAPNEAHNNEPLQSSSILPINVELRPVPKSTVKGGVFNNFLDWLSQRNMRRAKYPAPFDRFFKELDFVKLCSLLLGAMMASLPIFGQTYFNLISTECMRVLILMLIFEPVFLTLSYALQDMIPEVAVAFMLAGIAFVIAIFLTVVFNLLHLSGKRLHLFVSVFVVIYFVVLSLTLCKRNICRSSTHRRQDSTPARFRRTPDPIR